MPARWTRRVQVDLVGLLCDLAEAHAWSRGKIRDALGERDIDAVLEGTSLPEWDVVTALLAVIANCGHTLRSRTCGSALTSSLMPA